MIRVAVLQAEPPLALALLCRKLPHAQHKKTDWNYKTMRSLHSFFGWLGVALAVVFTPTFAMSEQSSPSPSLLPSSGEQWDVDLTARVTRAVDTHVIPGFQHLASTTKDLTNAIELQCRSQDSLSLKVAQSAFGKAVAAWAGVDYIRFGPLRDGGRATHVHFWPDPRGVTARQMRRVFAQHDPELLKPEILKNQSVAILGFGALEFYLLHTADPLGKSELAHQDGDYECLYARGVARLIESEAALILDEWQKPGGWRTLLVEPAANAEIYRSPAESTAQLVKSMLIGLELVREQSLVPLYEVANGKAKRAILPFQRLGLSADYIRAGLASLRKLDEALSLTDYARDQTAWTKKWSEQAYKALARSAEKLEVPESASMTPEQLDLANLRQMRFYSGGLRNVIARQIAPSAGLTIGFNQLDGD